MPLEMSQRKENGGGRVVEAEKGEMFKLKSQIGQADFW
jgi:hypothetical protein